MIIKLCQEAYPTTPKLLSKYINIPIYYLFIITILLVERNVHDTSFCLLKHFILQKVEKKRTW